MKPFCAGWETLEDAVRLEMWFKQNKRRFKGDPETLYTMLDNFCSSCGHPQLPDYLNFCNDIRDFDPHDQPILRDAFFAMYNLSPALLELKSVQVVSPDLN